MDNQTVWVRLLTLIGYQKWFLIINLVLLFGESFLSSIRNYFLAQFIAALSHSRNLLHYYLLRLALVIILHAIFAPLRSVGTQLLAATMAREMRARLFEAVLTKRLSELAEKQVGDLLLTFGGDVELAVMIIGKKFFRLALSLFSVLWDIAMIVYVDFRLGLLYSLFALLYAISIYLINLRNNQLSILLRTVNGKLASFLAEKFTAITLIKATGNESFEIKQHDKQLTGSFHLGLLKGLLRSCSVGISAFLPLFGVAVCIRLASDWGTNDVGTFAAFVFYCEDITNNCELFSLTYTQIITSVADLQRIMILWGDGIPPAVKGLGVRKLSTFHMDRVCFTYQDKEVLKNITFKVQAREWVGIVGQSGAGKSTFSKVFLRLLHPSKGQFLLDGIPVDNYSVMDYHEMITCVEQEPFIFSGTIKDNILYGNLQASGEQLSHAVEVAGLEEKDLQNVVFERGSNLSGGEKQRVAIARAIIAGVKFIVMDETASALDGNSQRELRRELEKLKKEGVGAMMLSQKEEGLWLCDRVWRLEDGGVHEVHRIA